MYLLLFLQGALEDKLAHVTVERDAFAAQLADLRRYQGGRVAGGLAVAKYRLCEASALSQADFRADGSSQEAP